VLLPDQLIAKKSHATQGRSLAKTVSWRILGSIDTFLVGWFVTGNLTFAGSIATLEILTKMVLYYFHERAWAFVSWGVK
jgi:uncharacterized membrane protein